MSESLKNAERTTVSFAPDTMAAGKALARSRGVKFSNLLEGLLERELQGTRELDSRDPECMLKLAEKFIPTWVPEVRQRVEGVDQPKVLEIILKLYASEELGLRDVWLREQYPAKDVAMAAEEVAKYGAKKKAPSPKTE